MAKRLNPRRPDRMRYDIQPYPSGSAASAAAALLGETGALAKETLTAGRQALDDWRNLRPVVKRLTELVTRYVETTTLDGPTAMRLLSSSGSVVGQLAKAASAILKTEEQQARMVVLLNGGVPQRRDPASMSEKQLVDVVIETAKRIKAEQGICPVCTPPPTNAEVVRG